MEEKNQPRAVEQCTQVEVLDAAPPRRKLRDLWDGTNYSLALREAQFQLTLEQLKAIRTQTMLKNTATFAMLEEQVAAYSSYGALCCRAIINAHTMESIKMIHKESDYL